MIDVDTENRKREQTKRNKSVMATGTNDQHLVSTVYTEPT